MAVDDAHGLLCENTTHFQRMAVAIVSLAEVSRISRIYIHILTHDCDRTAEEMLLDSTAGYSSLLIDLHYVKDTRLDSLVVDQYISKDTYTRVIAAEILPPDLDRIIYLDSDLVVLGDIGELWRLDMGDKAVAGVEDVDFGGTAPQRFASIGLEPGALYLNAGVLLLDLKRWRQQRIFERVLRFATSHGAWLMCHNQDALNAVLQDEMTVIDARWNVFAMAYSRKARVEKRDYYVSMREARRRLGIVHYTSSPKPWKFGAWCRQKLVYFRFLRKTAWRRVCPSLENRTQRAEYRIALVFDIYFLLHVLQFVRDRVRPARPFQAPAVTLGEEVPAIHLLFCASEAHLQHVAVSAVRTSRAGRLHLHVMTCGQHPAAEARLRETLQPYGHVALTFHRVDGARLDGFFVDRHVTWEAYLRFLAPEVLPPDVERVVYLDSDVVVLDDIRQLHDIDLGGKAAGAVSDGGWSRLADPGRLAALGIRPERTYVNSGVLVLDLARWRRNGITARLLDFVTRQGPALLRHHQDALNAVLADDIRIIDRRWNVQAMMFGSRVRRAFPEDYRATEDARRHPAIAHFSTDQNPCKLRAWTRKKALYFRFLDRTAWRGERPAGLTALQRLEYDLSRLLLRVGIDVYAAVGVGRRVRQPLAARRSQLAHASAGRVGRA